MMSSKVESEAVNVAVRSPIQTSRGVLLHAAASAVRRLTPERWIVDLLLVALVALLVGLTALGGLAVVSRRVPVAERESGCVETCRQHTAAPVAFGLWNDRACCEEVR